MVRPARLRAFGATARHNPARTIACALAGSGRYGEAEPYTLSFAEALDRMIGTEGDPRAVAQQFADIYAAWGKPGKAAEWRKRAGLPGPVSSLKEYGVAQGDSHQRSAVHGRRSGLPPHKMGPAGARASGPIF